MMKRIAAFLLVILLSLSNWGAVSAQADPVENKAKVLYDLGLLKGTGNGFSMESMEMDRNATRAEICVSIVRMLGKEEKAEYQANAHPFPDVPLWASNAVGWLYENYLVNGMSESYFGAQDIATVTQFATMLLRVLGYEDGAGDFAYASAVPFAKEKGLLDGEIETHWELQRRDMIAMCYNALRLPIQNSHRMLIEKLCDEGAADRALANELGIMKKPSLSEAFPDVPEILGTISATRQSDVVCIHFDQMAEHYGLRIFMRESENGVMTEIKPDGTPGFQKGPIRYQNGGSAGFVSDLYIHGLSNHAYSFIVLKTSSEGVIYEMLGKSAVAQLQEG
ncbi:MAG: hypothetical protein PUB07_01925 [Clostridia bacterium]|nr:hypothetical protein [Clostridia bacterium]